MIVTRVYVRCDGCKAASYGAGDIALTSAQVRAAARRAGWVREAGQDLCGRCVAARAAA